MDTNPFYQLAVWPESLIATQTPRIIQVPLPAKSSHFFKSWGVILTDSSECYSVCLKSLSLSFLSDSIRSISCNSSMAVLISFTGQAFVVGSDPEQYGLLGIEGCFETSIKIILPGVKCTVASVGQTHAALLDRNGSLYTWGSGHFGELGGEQIVLKQLPIQVTSAKIYSVKQVSCGLGFTVFCTAGGFLYLFGQLPSCLNSSGTKGNPSSIKGLEKLFIQSIVNCDDFVSVLTESKDTFVVHGCMRLVKLPYKYRSISGGKNALFGLLKDENTLHEWKISNKSNCKLQTLEAKSYTFDQISEETISIHSGESFSLGFSSCLKVEGLPIIKFHSTIRVVHALTVDNMMELQKDSTSSNPFSAKEPALKKISKIFSHHSTQVLLVYFNGFKEFAKLKKYFITNKNISALINAIAKVMQRNKVVLESKGFKDLIDFKALQEEIIMKNKSKRLENLIGVLAKTKNNYKIRAFSGVFLMYRKELLRNKGLEIINWVYEKRVEKRKAFGLSSFALNLKRIKGIVKGVEILVKVDCFLLKNRGFAVLFKIFNSLKTQLNVINHIFFFTSLKNSRILIVKYFDLWKKHRMTSKIEEINKKYATKTTARGIGMKLNQFLRKNCKYAWGCIKNYRKPVSNTKYGVLIMLNSCKKIQTRLKASAFKGISSNFKLKTRLGKVIRSLLKKKFSFYFLSLQNYIEERRQYLLLKILLRVSSLSEKIDYKLLVKYFSRFKYFGNLNRSTFTDRINRSDIKGNFKPDSSFKKYFIKISGNVSPSSPDSLNPSIFSPANSLASKNKPSTSTNNKKIEPSKTFKTSSFSKLEKKNSNFIRKSSVCHRTEKDKLETLINKIFEAETPVAIFNPNKPGNESQNSSCFSAASLQSFDKLKADIQEDPEVQNRLGCVSLENSLKKCITNLKFLAFSELKNCQKLKRKKIDLKFLESDESSSEEIREAEIKNEWVEQLQSLGAAVLKNILNERLKSCYKSIVA